MEEKFQFKSKTGFVLNAQGNLWAKDNNRFGLKMLQRMGWSSGKGLGKNEEGIKEQIKANGNRDNRGFGYEPRKHLLEHDSDYECVLSTLSAKYAKPEKNSSINADLKNKHRYKKIMQSKNVKLYSKKDLDSIFLKRENLCTTADKSEDSSLDNNTKTKYNSDIYVDSPVSIDEYFSKKIKRKKNVN